jgi:hypothetical protein
MDLSAYKLEQKRINSRRSLILNQFQETINKEREGTKWKPLTGKAIAIKTSHLNLAELEYFYSLCKDYKQRNGSFSKCFFGALKVDKK